MLLEFNTCICLIDVLLPASHARFSETRSFVETQDPFSPTKKSFSDKSSGYMLRHATTTSVLKKCTCMVHSQ